MDRQTDVEQKELSLSDCHARSRRHKKTPPTLKDQNGKQNRLHHSPLYSEVYFLVESIIILYTGSGYGDFAIHTNNSLQGTRMEPTLPV